MAFSRIMSRCLARGLPHARIHRPSIAIATTISLALPVEPPRQLRHNATRHFSSTPKYSLETLKTLRSQTGAPMVECKKALEASDNNLEAALDWLRQQGASKAASKLIGRETLHGLIGLRISQDGKEAALVQVAAETDFAGRSKTFVDLVVGVSEATLASHASGVLSQENVLAARTSDDKCVQELLNEAIVAIRENLSVSQAVKLTTTDAGLFVGYVHNKIDASNAGTSAALVEIQATDGDSKLSMDELQAIGKKLAMHVVAARPQYMAPCDVPVELVNKERDLLASQLEHTGKPRDVLDKIIEGRLRKFYEGICLTEQAHMIEEKNPRVADVLKRQGVTVKRFEALSIS
ncbi:hypothetical protein MPSEU_000389800 [Mayamaea pseudoterrestris]|nr:hypothetical protein MPSEU_000389800 [Mayamaea pseudoterrestris]